MKKFVFVVTSLLIAMTCHAQMNNKYKSFCVFDGVHYWAEAGVSYNKMSLKSSDFKLGYKAGLGADIPLYYSTVSFVPSILFECKGYKEDREESGDDVKREVTPMYILVPIDFSLNLPIGKKFGLQFCAGPYLAYGIAGKYTDTSNGYLNKYGKETLEFKVFKDDEYPPYITSGNTDIQLINEKKQLLKNFDFGVDVGARFIFLRYFMVKVNVEFGCINMCKDKDATSFRNLSLSAGLAFRY